MRAVKVGDRLDVMRVGTSAGWLVTDVLMPLYMSGMNAGPHRRWADRPDWYAGDERVPAVTYRKPAGEGPAEGLCWWRPMLGRRRGQWAVMWFTLDGGQAVITRKEYFTPEELPKDLKDVVTHEHGSLMPPNVSTYAEVPF